MKIKGLSKHVPVEVAEDAVEGLVPRRQRRSRWRTIAAAATAVTVLVVPAMAEADVGAVNQERAAAGLAPLSEDDGLTALAQQKAAEMAATGTLAHSSDLGGTVGSVLPSYTGAAENVGLGQSATTVTSAFMDSPTHRSAILGNYNTAGVGVTVGADGRVWVAQLFALASGGAPTPAPVAVAPAAVPAARAATAPRPAARSRRRCRTQTRRVARMVNGRRMTRVVRTRRCTGRKVTKRRVVRRRLVRG